MQSRCPYFECKQTFSVADELNNKADSCPNCGQALTIRSLERYIEIDRQLEKHKLNKTAADHQSIVQAKLPPMVAILEEIRSLWNIGSIFRSSDAAGFGHLFLLGISGCPPRKEIAKTSLGAEDHVSWSYAASALDLIPALHELGYKIIALEKNDSSQSLKSLVSQNVIQQPLCLIVGNEVSGIYAETLKASDFTCHLPMRGFKESLNVAVAFGIAAYAISDARDGMS